MTLVVDASILVAWAFDDVNAAAREARERMRRETAVALGALRHRVLLNFEGEAERIDPDTIIKGILENTPEPN